MTLLIIDVGSSSARVFACSSPADAPHLLAQARYAFSMDGDGTSVIDADALRAAVEASIDAALDSLGSTRVRAFGMTTFVGNLLGVDADGAALTPVYTYADTRSAEAAKRLRMRLPDGGWRLHQATGCRLHTAYHPAKLAWLREAEPALFDTVDQWTDFATYAYRRWFGRRVVTSVSVASWSGLLNRHTLTWADEALDMIALDAARLPALADVTAAERGLAADYAARWAALRDVPFMLAVGDGAAANIGSGGWSPEQPVVTMGTTAALRVTTRTPPAELPYSLWAYRIDTRRALIGGATSEGGNVYRWLRETLRVDDDELATLTTRAPGANGVVALPMLAGERSPGWHDDASAALHNLHLSTTALDMAQALMEGVAYQLRTLYTDMGSPGAALLAGGGALTASAVWADMLAAVLDRPLVFSEAGEVTAYGMALLLWEALDGTPLERLARATDPVRRVEPNRAHAAAYGRLYEGYRALYRTVYPGG